MTGVLERASRVAAGVARWVSVGMLVAMCVVTTAQVVFRYLLNNPLYWSEEASRYLFVWITFLGYTVAAEKRTEMSVSVFTAMLPKAARRAVDAAVHLAVIAFLAVFVREGVLLAASNAAFLTIALQLPWTVVYLAAPLGAAVLILVYAVRLAAVLGGAGPRPGGDFPAAREDRGGTA